MTASCLQSIARLEAWLTERAWPLWRDHGFDHRHGGFHEALDAVSLTCPVLFRRLRVLARQIYVFANAARHGLSGADALVARGLDTLLRRARQEDGGYAWRFALDGTPIDQRRDLYDHGFVLLALASAAPVVESPDLRVEALRLVGWLDSHMRHPAGGYREALPETGEARRQNSHMHLLEAMLACRQAFGDEIFLARADEIVSLFLTRFFDRRSGTLTEFFDAALRPLPAGSASPCEPGHHAEWVFLLDWHRRCRVQAGCAALPAARRAGARLGSFAERFGVHAGHGALVDAMTADGMMVSAASRLWPQTERLKAAILNRIADPAGPGRAIAALAPFLDHPVAGLWHERRRADGRFIDDLVPASSLYHLTSGILHAARLAREIPARPAPRIARFDKDAPQPPPSPPP